MIGHGVGPVGGLNERLIVPDPGGKPAGIQFEAADECFAPEIQQSGLVRLAGHAVDQNDPYLV